MNEKKSSFFKSFNANFDEKKALKLNMRVGYDHTSLRMVKAYMGVTL